MANEQALRFLEAFERYLTWRLSGHGGPEPLEFEQSFAAWLTTLAGDERNSELGPLVGNMKKMKEGRGTTFPPPG